MDNKEEQEVKMDEKILTSDIREEIEKLEELNTLFNIKEQFFKEEGFMLQQTFFYNLRDMLHKQFKFIKEEIGMIEVDRSIEDYVEKDLKKIESEVNEKEEKEFIKKETKIAPEERKLMNQIYSELRRYGKILVYQERAIEKGDMFTIKKRLFPLEKQSIESMMKLLENERNLIAS